jgi:DNA-binding transcriptional LysR family regulator
MADLRQLQQFIMVATELNFRRAAQRLHMSQPPLSAAIRRLEQDMGLALFERTRQYVRLTAAGEVFLRESRRTLAQARFAVEAAQGMGSGLSGVLRFSFVPSAALDVLPQLLQRFQQDHPGVRLILTGASTQQEVARLRSEVTDLALIVPPLADPRGLEITVLRREKMVLAVPATHPLSAMGKISLRMLVDEPFISFSYSEGSGFAGSVLAACHSAGFSPRIEQEASQMQTILTLVASGLGIAFVPSALSAIHMGNVCYLDIEGPEELLSYELALARVKGNSSAVVDAFIAMAKSAF